MNLDISPFEAFRRTNPLGNEFWSSRDFARVLGYTNSSGQPVDYFVEVNEMIKIGKGGRRPE